MNSCGAVHKKKALVTGASSGLGRETALELAREGAEVALGFSGNEAGAVSAAAEIERIGGRAHVIRADLSVASEAKRLADDAAALMGGLEILVNNAGITKTKRFFEMTEEDYDKSFDLNMRGIFFCAQAAAKHMAKSGGGSIVNMSSTHAMASLPGYSVYASTKGAIVSFTKQLAVELARKGIRVNCIVPGCILVDRNFSNNPETDAAIIAESIPSGTIGTPSDIAKTIVFLASGAASYVNGAVIVADGGLLCKNAIVTPEASD